MLTKIFALLFPLSLAFGESTVLYEEAIKAFLYELLGAHREEESDSFNTTHHEIQLADITFAYTAIAGTLPQFATDGKKVGQIFFTAYLKSEEDTKRPITFIFNGGPGGSSLAMHIGGFGPRRLALPAEGQKPLPPYRIIDNPETLLECSDLVFIDPMGTGYSRTEKDEYKSLYYSVEGDLASFAEFIRVFCIHFDRWNSPKYLFGASYGTVRACGLAEVLAYQGIYLNGIALMSCAIDYTTVFGERDQPLSDCLHIPTLAATAWYHGRTMQDKTLEEVVDFARRFSYEQYAPVMLQPSRLNPSEQRAFYQTFADLIGLPLDTIRRYEGRIDERKFITEFFAADRKIIGGFDSRYIGDVSAIGGEYLEDPSYREIRPAFYATFLHYLQKELQTKIKAHAYEDFSSEVFMQWNWSTYDSSGMPSFLQRLRRTLIANPHMKVFIGSGYYDLRTPFMAAEYSLEHLELPEKYRQNFQVEYYEAGHGYIFDLPSLKKFKRDVQRFYSVKEAP